MICRGYCFSTATAWEFIDTSKDPLEAPITASAGMSHNKLEANAGRMIENESNSAVTPTTRRLPKREVRAPVIGMENNAPTAAANKANPSSPSLSERSR